MIRLFLPILIVLLSFGSAFAQNTGGVFPPGFGADHKSAQYRIAIDTDANRFNQRLQILTLSKPNSFGNLHNPKKNTALA